MRQLFLTILFNLFFITSFLQLKSQNKQPEIVTFKNTHIEVYKNALKAEDYSSAITALNYIVAIDSNSNYKDSLAVLYYLSGKYHQSIYWSNKILLKTPNNIGIIEIKAASLKQTNQSILAISEYEKLIKLEQNPIYVFNLIELQYQMKRLYECIATTQTIENLTFKSEMKYHYEGLGEDKKSYSTLLKASMYNYQGLALYELGSKDLAMISFQESLRLDSTFIHAKENLKIVTTELSNLKLQEKTSTNNLMNKSTEFKKD